MLRNNREEYNVSDFNVKSVIVLGAGALNNIGQATARRFAQAGARL